MAHEVRSTDGLFTVRMAAWHGLGVVFDDYPTREMAQAIAHPWEPEGEPIYRKTLSVDENGDPLEGFKRINGWKVNVRNDNDDDLGVLSESFETVLNNELWDVAEALEGSGEDVMFETGGSLRGGKQVWVLLRLQEPLVVPGDPRGETIPYYALQNSHDGSGAFRGQATMTRIVCANTAKIADLDAQARGTEFTFRHSKNVGQRIEEAKSALAGWRQSLDAWQEASTAMIQMTTEPFAAGRFLERFIPMPPENLITERVRENVIKERAKWLESYNSVTGEGIQNTVYGLVQASVEYLEWHRRAFNAENRFRRTFLSKENLVSNAVSLAKQAAHA